MITTNKYIWRHDLDHDEYELRNTPNTLISDNNNVYLYEENTKIECNNGERFSLEEYIKKQLNCDIGEI